MRRRCTTAITGSYNPPRARTWSGARYAWDEVRQCLWFQRLRPAGNLKAWDVVAGLVCPGYALGVMGWKWMGRILLAGYGLGWLTFLAWLGHNLSNVALGLLLSAHAISILGLLTHQFGPFGLRARMMMTLTVLAALYLVAYRPALDWFFMRWALPVLVRERVLIVQPEIPGALARGDQVVYSFYPMHGGGREGRYYVEGGLGLAPILAQGGDRVDFYPDRFEVNGVPDTRRPFMPEQGGLVVPQNHWLIWPEMSMVVRDAAAATQALLRMAVVPEGRLMGRPYRHWFGRTQQL